MSRTKPVYIAASAILVGGLILRLWNINFGLPHSWYADEPEMGEPAIKYTYELRNIIRNNDVYKLVPESYVYGTFPVYFYTILTMAFSKTANILGVIISKMDLYVFMRIINALMGFLIIPVFYLLIRGTGLNRHPTIALAGLFLTAFNWKFIAHAHYLNHDIIITLLILLSNYFFYRYLICRHITKQPEKDTINTIFFAVFFGLAVSTKITVLITLPVYLLFFLRNRDLRNLFASIFIILGTFMVTNPFSWIFINDFFSRLLEMRTKEAGLVFDSADYSRFKYVQASSWILTLPVFLMSIWGVFMSFKERGSEKKQFYTLMALEIVIYLVFFSLQSRRVDRWMLPVIPNLILFCLVAFYRFLELPKTRVLTYLTTALIMITSLYYLYYPSVLLSQFQRNTPKSAAYIWAKENLPETATKFGLTEEGLDPLNKLSLSTVWQYNVYESNGAQFIYPPDPTLYDYIIISSRPVSWTSGKVVSGKYPYYAAKWSNFTAQLNDPAKFSLVNSFKTTNPNLIPLSEVYIYKKLP